MKKKKGRRRRLEGSPGAFRNINNSSGRLPATRCRRRASKIREPSFAPLTFSFQWEIRGRNEFAICFRPARLTTKREKFSDSFRLKVDADLCCSRLKWDRDQDGGGGGGRRGRWSRIRRGAAVGVIKVRVGWDRWKGWDKTPIPSTDLVFYSIQCRKKSWIMPIRNARARPNQVLVF